MDEDYAKDQRDIQSFRTAVQALDEVRHLRRPMSKDQAARIDRLIAEFNARAEQIQAVWN